MIFRTPIDRSTSAEIAQELVRVGDKDFEIKIGDVVMVAVNPGGVIGENTTQLIFDLRREVVELLDQSKANARRDNDDEDEDEIETLRARIEELRDEVNEFEEHFGRLTK